tara:strand:- start:1003 stop:1440 length:438 start_codon:yes stop_codon:yes gene_type:complete
MRYRALLRVILLVWIHISLVSATLNHHQAKEFTELARLFVAENHHQSKNNRSLAHKLVMERFLKQAAVILGITFTAFTLEKVSYVPARLALKRAQNFPLPFDTSPSSIPSQIKAAFRYQVAKFMDPERIKASKDKQNDARSDANA